MGGSGFLGSYFLRSLGNRATAHSTRTFKTNETEARYQSFLFRKNDLDGIKFFLEKQNCGTIVNCTALADIEECESNPEMAYWINSELPGLLSFISMTLDSKFVHISTDAVFDGSTSFPTELDSASPISVYGKSKLSGEHLVMENNPKSLVARVNFFGYSKNKPSLFNHFFESLLLGKKVMGYTDVYFTPLYAADLVEVIMELLRRDASGLFHLVGNERISKFDFGVLIGETFDLPTDNLKKGKITGTQSATLRSLDLSLGNDKVKSMGISLPSVQDGLSILKKSISEVS